jgi:hypothetical protein
MADLDDMVLFTQAQIVVRAADSAPLLSLAKKRALDASIFDEFPPFLWQSEISSDRLDAYFTIMDPETTLANFAADAETGVAVLVGHDSRQAPTGYSLTGSLDAGKVTRVLSDAYALTDPASSPIINKVRAGVIRDVSVGFSTRGAQCVCSICLRDMWRDYKCWHIPGMRYKRTDNVEDAVTDPNGVLATGRIVGAHLSEYSLVYDGATPGAAVLQAQRSAAAGMLTSEQVRHIERQFHTNLPDKRISAPGITLSKGAAMDEQELQRVLEAAGVPTDLTGIDRIRHLATENARLAPLAADGTTYRADLVAAGVAEAVRAFGAEAGEKKRDMLLRMDLETIKDMTASWRDIGDTKLPGGRSTTNEQNPEPEAIVYKKVNVGGLSRS